MERSSRSLRSALPQLAAIVLMGLSCSCGTLHRAGKDLVLGVGAPALMVYDGAADGLTTSRNVREGIGGGALVQGVAFPFTFAIHAIEHGVYGITHLVDLPLCPIYGALELYPYGPHIEPLNIYRETWFDDAAARQRSGTAAEEDAG